MDRLQAMRVFTRIVELGSFTRAADDLSLPRATLTHTIKRLEERVGAHLLQRTTRRVRPTRDGEVYYNHCVRLLADLDAVEADFREAAVVPKGRLRVDLASSLARMVLIPALPAFLQRYPQIELDLGTSDRFIDLVQEGVDCVLRAGDLPDSTMVGRRVANLSQATVASAAYVKRRGLPQTLADLQNGHVAVNWSSPTTRRTSPLEFMVGKRMREVSLPSAITVSGTDAYLACCQAGLGMAQFPRYRVEDELKRGKLVEILPAMPPPAFPVSVVYPSQRPLPLRLRVFIDWVAEVMGTLR
ncbi:transcriptional regulator, LysR family [Dyella jiangningensis]|uniref:LysR family transcriptional regulator n=1 Tax=Dyella sp. AtDHG13 TaxID=1938897 RepID=UPI0008922A34|nr:LysR family transcriptional regulator [Dyella sp. AtDHG13]PXV59075.1 LysR family transcriptional regulator [Dyella sp. AtDHG13]SDL27236.1 transcriptional regulator, LysR family [Dyella jiangningensis]